MRCRLLLLLLLFLLPLLHLFQFFQQLLRGLGAGGLLVGLRLLLVGLRLRRRRIDLHLRLRLHGRRPCWGVLRRFGLGGALVSVLFFVAG